MLEHMVVVQNIVYGAIEPAASPESSASEHQESKPAVELDTRRARREIGA